MDAWTEEIVQNHKTLVGLGEMKIPVRVNFGNIGRFASSNRGRRAEPWSNREPGIHPVNDFVYAGHLFLGNALNFYFKDLSLPGGTYALPYPGKGTYGARSLWALLTQRWPNTILSAHEISLYCGSLATVRDFFQTPIMLLELRMLCMEDYCRGLIRYFDGYPLAILAEAQVPNNQREQEIRAFNGGRGLVEILVDRFPVAYGADIDQINGLKFRFAKRARLAALMVHMRSRALGGDLFNVADIYESGPIVDPQVCRVLRHLEILEFDPELEAKVNAQEEISKFEATCIRMAGTVACYHLAKQMEISAGQNDQLLFSMARGLPNPGYLYKTSDC